MSAPADNPLNDDDAQLVHRSKSGCREAFDTLVTRYQGGVAAVVCRFSRRHADVEDMVQETFLNAWRGLEGWRGDAPFAHWLKRIAYRAGLEFCRRHRRTPFGHLHEKRTDEPHPLEHLADSTPDVGTAGEAAEEAQHLLSHLTPEERTVLTLLHLNEIPLAEIAAGLGWSIAKTKVRAFRARQRLKTILTRHGTTGK
jgi:RNA polymerase sigma-70 factor (ECF subfamily)